MIQFKFFTIIFCTAILFSFAGTAEAFNPQPEPPGSVAIGLTPDQFARINVVNATDRISGIVPCVCPVLLTLIDETGLAIASHEMDVDPGAIGSFEVEAGSGARQTVRALVEFPGSEGERLACYLGTRSALEIVESTDGATVDIVPIVTNFLKPTSR